MSPKSAPAMPTINSTHGHWPKVKRETLPAVNGFVQRLKANATGIEYRRTRDGRFFLGMIVHHFAPPGTFP